MNWTQHFKQHEKKKQITLHIDEVDLAKIKADAKQLGVSVSEFFRGLYSGWEEYKAEKESQPKQPDKLEGVLDD